MARHHEIWKYPAHQTSLDVASDDDSCLKINDCLYWDSCEWRFFFNSTISSTFLNWHPAHLSPHRFIYLFLVGIISWTLLYSLGYNHYRPSSFLSTSLLSGTRQCFRLTLYLPYPQRGVSHSSTVTWSSLKTRGSEPIRVAVLNAGRLTPGHLLQAAFGYENYNCALSGTDCIQIITVLQVFN